MKILLVGDKSVWAIERYYLKHLTAKNIVCEIFGAGNMFRENYQSLFQKIRHKIWPTRLYRKINNKLLQHCIIFQPTVVWVFKGMEILPETLKRIEKMGICLVNYNPDHPFTFSSKGSGNSNVSNSIALYNLHYSYNTTIVEKINREYNIPSAMLPFGFDHEGVQYGFIPKEEIIEIAFVGNPDHLRKELILYIANHGFKVNVYGHSWQKHLSKTNNITIHDAIYQEDLWLTLQKYRLQLNIFRHHNLGSHNMRTFEIPSVGGIMLAPQNKQHSSFFIPGEEAFFYENKKDLLIKIDQILQLTSKEANEVRKAAFEKSKNFTYLKRTEEFLSTLYKYIK